jgi:adenylylsulfate reductase, subunit B
MPPEIDYEKCTACGMCVDVCAEDVFFPHGAEKKEGENPSVVYPEACFHCHLCAQACPVEAITIRTLLIMHVPYK